jgi:plasmid stability protein
MRATQPPIRIDDKLWQALQKRAAIPGKSVSQVAREILSEALEESPLAERTGHLRGQLKLSPDTADPWRQQIRERNWRP